MIATRTTEQIALRGLAADFLYQARAGGMTTDILASLRKVGANLGWAEEAQMVRMTGAGSRPWSPAEIDELLTNRRESRESRESRDRHP
jgi:hypothetical protein